MFEVGSAKKLPSKVEGRGLRQERAGAQQLWRQGAATAMLQFETSGMPMVIGVETCSKLSVPMKPSNTSKSRLPRRRVAGRQIE